MADFFVIVDHFVGEADVLEGICQDIANKLNVSDSCPYADLVKYLEDASWLGGSKQLMLEILEGFKQPAATGEGWVVDYRQYLERVLQD